MVILGTVVACSLFFIQAHLGNLEKAVKELTKVIKEKGVR